MGSDTGRATDVNTVDSGLAAELRLRAALSGSSILPSDTSVRYVTLVGMVFATTIVIYLRLWLDRLDSEDAYQACAAALSRGPLSLLSAMSLDAINPLIEVWLRCGKPYAATALTWALAGVLAVAGVAAITYLMMPWWRIRRCRLQPLDRVRSADLHAHLDYLVGRMGLASRRPTFWLAPQASSQGVAFGRQTRCHVQLNAGLVKKWRTDRPAVTAVVLHELAHVRNRDIRYTYLTITTWWAFTIVALFPYVLTSVVPLALGGYPSWWPAGIRASSVNGRVVMSVLVMAALAYLMYTAILRAREMHADATATTMSGNVDANDAALRRILNRSQRHDKMAAGFLRTTRRLWQRWAVLRKHPSVEQRLATLNDPTRLYSAGALEIVGAGVAIAVVQTNLLGLAAQATIALTPTGRSTASLAGYVALFLVPYGVSSVLIAAVAWVTVWRARLRAYPDSLPRRVAWLGPAAALGVGLLIGEPLSVYLGTQNFWGLFDGIGAGDAGVAGVVGAVVSATALIFGVAVLFAWMSECAVVWIPVTRGSLRLVGLIASLVGAFAFLPAYASWFSVHDTGFVLSPLNLYGGLSSGWASSWKPPGISLVYAEYLPILLFSIVPGVGVLLALPWLFLVTGTMRRPRSGTPRWLRSAGPIAAGIRPPPQLRIRVGAAIWTGLAGALTCLVTAMILAMVVWDHTRGSSRGSAAVAYLLFATIMLAVAFSAISAAIVVARTRQAGGTLAVLAAFVTIGVVAIATPFVAIVGVCGPVDVLARASCRGNVARLTPEWYALAMFIGAPRAVIAACLAGAAAAALCRLVRGSRFVKEAAIVDSEHPADARPSMFRQAVLIAFTVAVIANLAIGGYVGYGIIASGL
jgi:Zn-dependent protease with chaperone function